MKSKFLPNINSPEDLRKLSPDELPQLAAELRDFIINIVAVKEGHLGASLGVVELTIALHYLFDTPNDLLIWDVGHQAYGHKILTGRRDNFHTNRQLNGISGFPKRAESPYDVFGTGHSSTSISAIMGMAMASKIKNENREHIAVIGDASIASGMAFEALNHLGDTDANVLIILNDNAMGIDPSVGALKHYLTSLKDTTNQTHQNIFQNLNLNYSGPIDGHDFDVLLSELTRLKSVKGPKLLHVITTKGKGLLQAETHQTVYHAPGKFDAITGEIPQKTEAGLAPKFQDVFGETLVLLAEKNKKIVGITPAMPTGSSMKLLMDTFPERTFDVGIAEQHAVTFAAGLATQGMVVFCNIYSTFLQRAYDQIIHDVALQHIPVIFCLDRAGLVGEDGATHHGVFDLAYLRCIPNMLIYAPKDEVDLQNILYTASLGLENPIAIRYPRGRGFIPDFKPQESLFSTIEIGKAQRLKNGTSVAILSTGTMAQNVATAIEKSGNETNFSHYHFGFVKPLDEKELHAIFEKFNTIITIEDGTILGGFGSGIVEFATANNYKNTIEILGIPDKFIEQGSITELQKLCGLDIESLSKKFNLY